MRSRYVALLAFFLDPVVGVNVRRSAEDVFLGDGLEKRADTTTIPAAINIEPSQYWDGNDGPWSSFALQVGTPKQDIRVMISTAAFNTWTINEDLGCPNGTIVGCEDSRGTTFLTNKSLTWIENSIFTLDLEENLYSNNPTGSFGFDTITLGWQGSGLPTVDHMVIASISDDNYWLGVFGLNPQPTNFTTYNDPQTSFMSALRNNNSIPSLAYSYTAGNQYRFAGDQYGSLVLGGYDQSKFTATNVTIDFGADVSRDLLIGVQSITTNASGTTNTSSTSNDSSTSLTSAGFYAFIDSTIAQLWLPLSVCEAFEDSFGIEWDEDSEYYLVNDSLHKSLLDSNPSVTFTLGSSSSGGDSVDVTLPYDAFDLEIGFPIFENATRYFPLKRAANSTQYTLGRTFLQEAYLIADYERRNFTIAPCEWTENADSDIRSILSPDYDTDGSKSGSGGLGGGAIAGIVIGVLAAVVLAAAALWWWRRRQQNEKKRMANMEAKAAAADSSDQGSTTAYSDNAATKTLIAGELGNDSEIHEMQVPYKAPVAEIDSPTGQGWGAHHEYYGKDGGAGTMGSGTLGTGTWQSGLTEVEGNNEQIYELQGSDVHELPDSRRQSWADGDDEKTVGYQDVGKRRA